MKWFKCYVSLPRNPKRYDFEKLAGTNHGLHYIVGWFCYVAEFAPTGDVSRFRPEALARACEWSGDADVFWKALEGAGFIEKTDSGFKAHDWADEHSRFIKENIKTKGKDKKPTGFPRVSHGKSALEEKRQEEKRQEKTVAAGAAEKAPQEPKDEESLKTAFLAFWTAYPKRHGKSDAWKAWKALNPLLVDLEAIQEALTWQKKQKAWQDKQFIPLPATWIRGRRWEDEREQSSRESRENTDACPGPGPHGGVRNYCGSGLCDQCYNRYNRRHDGKQPL